MNTLLVAINAKYIHSNLAVYSLKAYAQSKGNSVEIAEYTINQQTDSIISDIYKKKPTLLGFSCYIWNIEYVKIIGREIKKLLPACHIFLGGPQVSYETSDTLKDYLWADGIMLGEGEISFNSLIEYISSNSSISDMQIPGILVSGSKEFIPVKDCIDMDMLPFPYEDISSFSNRIIYYESSRGCPYSCSYCLSGVDKQVRYRSLSLVTKELQFFIDMKVPQVKFVDRTFNCNRKRTFAIWSYILEHDNGITNFHFEISADIITDEEIALLSKMRPGLVQLEIGVQTCNLDTLNAIRRHTDLHNLSNTVAKINAGHNIHQHLDLIAGLPYEDYISFGNSFNRVFNMQPQQLQLGFLKVLKGSHMYEMANEYNIMYTDCPPFEVLSTPWLSYDDVLRLKAIEEMVEVYYNSGQFSASLSYILRFFTTPFSMFEYLANYYEANNLKDIGHSRFKRYEILLDAMSSLTEDNKDLSVLKEVLRYDMYLRENLKNRPAFIGTEKERKSQIHKLYLNEELLRRILPEYGEYTTKQIERMTNTEFFTINISKLLNDGDIVYEDNYLLFDYLCVDPVTGSAKTINVTPPEL